MIREAVEMWNEIATAFGWCPVRRLTSDRERKLRAILRNGMDDWKEALAKAQLSDFLCGKTQRVGKYENYRFNIDTMLREGFFVRLLEGAFDNPDQSAVSFKSPENSQWEARLKNYRPGGMWLSNWGPKPEEVGCQVPKLLVEEWKQRHMAAH